MINQLNMWYTNQLVTQGQMNDFSADLYFKNGFLTDAYVGSQGCIINLPTVTQVAGNITLSAGSFRFPNTTLAYLPYTPPLIGNCPSAVVAVSGNGFLVAQYVVTPVTSGAYEYIFTCSYAFVPTLLTNMVLIVEIVGGVIGTPGDWGIFSNMSALNYIQPLDSLYGNLDIISLSVSNNFNVSVTNTPISGNTPNSSISAEPDGSYTQAIMQTAFDDATSNIYATVSDGGDGNIKSHIAIQGLYLTNEAKFGINPNIVGNSYNGFYSSHYNTSDNGVHIALQECYPDSSDNMHATLWASNDNGTDSTDSGIACVAGIRPSLIGSSTGLTNEAASFSVIEDTLLDSGTANQIAGQWTGYDTVTSALGILQMQGGTITIPATNTFATFNFPVAFANSCLALVATVSGLTPETISTTQTNTTGTIILTNPAPGGGISVSWIAIGS